MIRRILIFTGLILLAYNLVLLLPQVRPQFWMDQGLHQQNVIKAQEYLLDREPQDVVIVGSSLAARLPTDQLGPRSVNLALAGGSVFTGLQLVAEHPAPPRLVLIETNIIMRGADRDVLENAHRPVISSLRRYVPALREKYQPSNIIAGRLFLQLIVRGRRALGLEKQPGDALQVASVSANPAEDPAAIALAEQRRYHSVAPDPEELAARIAELRNWITVLEQRGVRCIFLEMPVHETLVNSAHCAAIRTAIRQGFPAKQLDWIVPPADRIFHPRDGFHLGPEEAKEFASYIRAQVNAVEETVALHTAH